MSIITDFAQSGAWDYRNAIIPLAVGVPLAIEAAILAKNIYKKPHLIKEKFNNLTNRIIKNFTVQRGESKRDAYYRITKNALIVLSCLSLMATLSYASIVFLPSAFAITTAISSIFLVGKLFINAQEYKKKIIETFSVKEGEDPTEGKNRILKNILKTVAITTVAIALITIVSYFIFAPMLINGFTWQVYLPFQTKGVVFAEYASVGILNAGLAYHKWKKGDKWGALYHIFVGALSFIFPAFYWNTEMRLHHSFYGLLLMSTPFRSLRMLGGMVTFDSALYMLAPVRGYISYTQFNQYDFINTIVDNPGRYAGGYAASLMVENINDNWSEPQKQVQEKPACATSNPSPVLKVK